MSYTINLCTRDQNTGTVSRTDISSNVQNEFSKVDKLDESLDIGQITIRATTSSVPYDMFDWIEASFDGTEVLSQRIAGDSVTLISKNPLLYEHRLSLVEHTKILERFIISAKTFTQPKDTVDADGDPIPPNYYLSDVIQDLIDTVPLETDGNLTTTRIFKLPTSGDLYDLLTTTIAPEFTFKEITFREALNQVFGYIDAIPRLYLNSSDELEITCDFVNELKTLITSENVFIGKSLQQDVDFYATEMESESLNLVNDKYIGESIEVFPSENAFITARTDEYLFDFVKSYIPTYKPVYKLEKLICKVDVTVTDNGATPSPVIVYDDDIIVDLAKDWSAFTWGGTSHVVEQKSFQTLPATEVGDTNPQAYTKFNTIYWTFGEKNIIHSDTFGLFDTSSVVQNVIRIAVFQYLYDDGTIDSARTWSDIAIDINDNEDDLKFQPQYIPIPNSMRLRISRQDLSDVEYNSNMVANQQGRVINLENFTNNLQGKINRIGNSELMLENRVTSFSELYEVGDYTSDVYIVTKRELIFYKDHIYAKYDLSKNYNMISKFIGVNTELRQWDISEKNTLQRNLLYKEYVEVNAEVSSGGVQATTITDDTKNFTAGSSNNTIDINDGAEAPFNIGDFVNLYDSSSGLLVSGIEVIGKGTGFLEGLKAGASSVNQENGGFVELPATGGGSNDTVFLDGTFASGTDNFIETFKPTSTLEPVNGGVIKGTDFSDNVLVSLSSVGGGNSLIFNFQLPDNKSGGSYKEDYTATGLGTQVAMDFVPYTDEDAFSEDLRIYMFDKFVDTLTDTQIDNLADDLPKVSSITYLDNILLYNSSSGNYELKIKKDSREVIGFTYQLQMVAKDVGKIVIGRMLALKNRLISSEVPTSVKLYTSTTKKIGRTDTLKLNTTGYSLRSGATITTDTANYKVTVSDSNLDANTTSWVLTDEDDFVLIGVNQEGVLLNSLTFDFLNKRSDVKYKY